MRALLVRPHDEDLPDAVGIVSDDVLIDSASKLLHVALAVRADGVLTSAEFPALLVQVEQTKRDLDAWLEEQRRFLVVEAPR